MASFFLGHGVYVIGQLVEKESVAGIKTSLSRHDTIQLCLVLFIVVPHVQNALCFQQKVRAL